MTTTAVFIRMPRSRVRWSYVKNQLRLFGMSHRSPQPFDAFGAIDLASFATGMKVYGVRGLGVSGPYCSSMVLLVIASFTLTHTHIIAS